MANVERNIVSPPNEKLRDGNVNSCGNMGRMASPVTPPNAHIHYGNTANGFESLARRPSGAMIPDHSFDVMKAKMPQPHSVTTPGKGIVPSNPFQTDGKPTGLQVPFRRARG
jgi:hypothetical protein